MMYGFPFATQDWESLLSFTKTQILGDLLGQICFPHIHTAPSNTHTWNGVIQSFSLGLWCFPGHPGSSGKGSLLSYAAFRGSTMVSLEVLDGLMWLFPDCSNLTLHD